MKKKTRRFSWAWRVSGCSFAFGVFVFANVYDTRILPGVRVGSIPVGSLTKEQALVRVENVLSQPRVVLTHNQRSWRLTYADLGATHNVKRAVDEAWAVGRQSGLAAYVKAPLLRTPLALPLTISPDVLASVTARIASEIGTPPLDAAVEIRDGAFSVIPEREGIVVDSVRLQSDLDQALGLAQPVRIELQPELASPRVSASDLSELVRTAEQMVSRPLTLKGEGKTFVVDRDQLMRWTSFRRTSPEVSSLQPTGKQAPLELILSAEVISQYLEQLASELDAQPSEQRVLKSANKIEIMNPGKTGRKLAIDEAVPLLKHHLLAGVENPVDLPFLEVPAPVAYEDPPAAPTKEGKVIAVDLTKLHEYLYENGELVYSAKISPGINNWTPTGTFKIYAKTKKQKMSGPGYYLPNVPNILWFKGDYSIHGVYWHNDFGIRPRSHGCVGQSLEDAEWVYDWAEVGTPVVIYKSQ